MRPLSFYGQRSGTSWFLSAINGLQPKTVNIQLSFLGKGDYHTLVLMDNDENPADAVISKGNASENDIVRIKLGVGGGFMMRITKSENQ